MPLMQVEIVSQERSIYSGEASFLVAPGIVGDIGIYPRHAPLLTRIRSGLVRLMKPDQLEILIAVSGGILEIQPLIVTVLADIALRDDELDEQRAIRSKKMAEEALKKAHNEQSLVHAKASLDAAIAELKALAYLRHQQNKHLS